MFLSLAQLFGAFEMVALASGAIGLGRTLASDAKGEVKARKTGSFFASLIGMSLVGALARPVAALAAPQIDSLDLGR